MAPQASYFGPSETSEQRNGLYGDSNAGSDVDGRMMASPTRRDAAEASSSHRYPPDLSRSSEAHHKSYNFSTQLRKGSVDTTVFPQYSQHQHRTSDAPYDSGAGPSGEASSSSNTPSSYCTHLSVKTVLSSLSPHPTQPIDPLQGLSSSSISAIRGGLPWSTVTKDPVDGKDKTARGYNEFVVKETESAWSKLLEQLKEPLILLLLASAVVSLLLGETDDAISIILAVSIVIAVAFVQERRSSESLEALTKLVPHYCHLVRDGVTSNVLANEVVPGDIVTFSTGDRVPADVRIIEATSLQADESTLTGEIKPLSKKADTVEPEIPATRCALNHQAYGSDLGGTLSLPSNIDRTSIGERDNIVFMGTLIKSGYGRGIVIGTGPHTEFGAIFSMVDEVNEKRTPLQLSMDDLAKKLSMISFGIIGIICLIGLIQRRNALEMFTIGVSLAVAAIPEGLPIVVTVTLALGVLRMSHRKAIVKRLPSVETLGSVSVICSDKTGTLTTNKMTVCRCWTFEDGMLDLTKRDGIPHSLGRALSRTIMVGNLCNNSHRDEKGENVGQPTDAALVSVLRVFDLEDKRPYFKRSAETAFDSEHKYMSVTGKFVGEVAAPPAANIGNGETIYLKGAIEAVLDHCNGYIGANSSATSVPINDEIRQQIRKAVDELASQGLRVIGCATGALGSEQSNKMTFCGLQAMQDPPRHGVKEAVGELRRSGVQLIMITGDSEVTALAIAKQVGMVDESVSLPKSSKGGVGNGRDSHHPQQLLTGREIDALTERQLTEIIGRVSIFARTTPRHKMDIVKALQANGQVVAMTGDGVNDAPALKMADIGIALGASGTDVAKEAADVILVDDNFATILPAVEEGKGIFYNIQNFLSFQLSTAVAALSLITLSTAFGLKLPLNPMQILFINILMDGPPSQSLGVDPVDRSVVMQRKPRRKDAPVLTRRLMYRILFSASIVVLGTLYVYVSELTGDGFADERDQTMTFTCFVFLDLTSAIQNRGLTTGLVANRMLVLTVGISFFVQLLLIYFPLLQGVFQTTSLSFSDMSFLFTVAALGWSAHEARRWYERRWIRAGGKLRDDEEEGDTVAWLGRTV